MFMVTGEICNKIQESVDANECETTKDKIKLSCMAFLAGFLDVMFIGGALFVTIYNITTDIKKLAEKFKKD